MGKDEINPENYLAKPSGVERSRNTPGKVTPTLKAEAVDQAVEDFSHLAQHQGPLRILLVEDVPINQVIATKILENMGYRVDIAANGQEAVKAMIEKPFDLILMDCQMPEMDGYEATRTIRKHPQIKHRGIPIIAMTAGALKGDAEKCRNAGMDDYLSKPMKANLLSKVLTKWLQV